MKRKFKNLISLILIFVMAVSLFAASEAFKSDFGGMSGNGVTGGESIPLGAAPSGKLDNLNEYRQSKYGTTDPDYVDFKEVDAALGVSSSPYPSNPYTGKKILINDAEDLYNWSFRVAGRPSSDALFDTTYVGTYNFYSTAYFMLADNIDYSVMDTPEYKLGFVPVGCSNTRYFYGTFDGQGFNISNLFFGVDYMLFNTHNSTQPGSLAMFAKNDGIIKNLGLIRPKADINAYDWSSNQVVYDAMKQRPAAGLCGINDGVIEFCFVDNNNNQTAANTLAVVGNDVTSGGAVPGSAGICLYNNSGSIAQGPNMGAAKKIDNVYYAGLLGGTEPNRAPLVLHNGGTLTNAYYDLPLAYKSGVQLYVNALPATNTGDWTTDSWNRFNNTRSYVMSYLLNRLTVMTKKQCEDALYFLQVTYGALETSDNIVNPVPYKGHLQAVSDSFPNIPVPIDQNDYSGSVTNANNYLTNLIRPQLVSGTSQATMDSYYLSFLQYYLSIEAYLPADGGRTADQLKNRSAATISGVSQTTLTDDRWYTNIIWTSITANSGVSVYNTHPRLAGLFRTALQPTLKRPADVIYLSLFINAAGTNISAFSNAAYPLTLVNDIDMSYVSEKAYKSFGEYMYGTFIGTAPAGQSYISGAYSVINLRITTLKEVVVSAGASGITNVFCGMFANSNTTSGMTVRNVNFIGGYCKPEVYPSGSTASYNRVYYIGMLLSHAQGALTLDNVHSSADVIWESKSKHEDGTYRYTGIGQQAFIGGLVGNSNTANDKSLANVTFSGKFEPGTHDTNTNSTNAPAVVTGTGAPSASAAAGANSFFNGPIAGAMHGTAASVLNGVANYSGFCGLNILRKDWVSAAAAVRVYTGGLFGAMTGPWSSVQFAENRGNIYSSENYLASDPIKENGGDINLSSNPNNLIATNDCFLGGIAGVGPSSFASATAAGTDFKNYGGVNVVEHTGKTTGSYSTFPRRIFAGGIIGISSGAAAYYGISQVGNVQIINSQAGTPSAAFNRTSVSIGAFASSYDYYTVSGSYSAATTAFAVLNSPSIPQNNININNSYTSTNLWVSLYGSVSVSNIAYSGTVNVKGYFSPDIRVGGIAFAMGGAAVSNNTYSGVMTVENNGTGATGSINPSSGDNGNGNIYAGGVCYQTHCVAVTNFSFSGALNVTNNVTGSTSGTGLTSVGGVCWQIYADAKIITDCTFSGSINVTGPTTASANGATNAAGICALLYSTGTSSTSYMLRCNAVSGSAINLTNRSNASVVIIGSGSVPADTPVAPMGVGASGVCYELRGSDSAYGADIRDSLFEGTISAVNNSASGGMNVNGICGNSTYGALNAATSYETSSTYRAVTRGTNNGKIYYVNNGSGGTSTISGISRSVYTYYGIFTATAEINVVNNSGGPSCSVSGINYTGYLFGSATTSSTVYPSVNYGKINVLINSGAGTYYISGMTNGATVSGLCTFAAQAEINVYNKGTASLRVSGFKYNADVTGAAGSYSSGTINVLNAVPGTVAETYISGFGYGGSNTSVTWDSAINYNVADDYDNFYNTTTNTFQSLIENFPYDLVNTTYAITNFYIAGASYSGTNSSVTSIGTVNLGKAGRTVRAGTFYASPIANTGSVSGTVASMNASTAVLNLNSPVVVTATCYIAGVLCNGNISSVIGNTVINFNASLTISGSSTNTYIAGVLAYGGSAVNSVSRTRLNFNSTITATGTVTALGIAGVAGYVTSAYSLVNYTDINLNGVYSSTLLMWVAGINCKYIITDYTAIYNCVNYGNIDVTTSGGYYNIGGVLSEGYRNNYTSYLTSVFNKGNITFSGTAAANSAIGGIIASYATYYGSYYSTIVNSANFGNIYTYNTSGAVAVGGIVGKHYTSYQVTVGGCVNSGNISQSGANTNYLGGLYGYGTSTVIIESSVNYGNVTGGLYSGGISGNNTSALTIRNVVNHGNVTGATHSGGIAGYSTSTLTMNWVVNYGQVTGTTNAGGILGYKTSTTSASYVLYVQKAGGASNLCGTSTAWTQSVANTIFTTRGTGDASAGITAGYAPNNNLDAAANGGYAGIYNRSFPFIANEHYNWGIAWSDMADPANPVIYGNGVNTGTAYHDTVNGGHHIYAIANPMYRGNYSGYAQGGEYRLWGQYLSSNLGVTALGGSGAWNSNANNNVNYGTEPTYRLAGDVGALGYILSDILSANQILIGRDCEIIDLQLKAVLDSNYNTTISSYNADILEHEHEMRLKDENGNNTQWAGFFTDPQAYLNPDGTTNYSRQDMGLVRPTDATEGPGLGLKDDEYFGYYSFRGLPDQIATAYKDRLNPNLYPGYMVHYMPTVTEANLLAHTQGSAWSVSWNVNGITYTLNHLYTPPMRLPAQGDTDSVFFVVLRLEIWYNGQLYAHKYWIIEFNFLNIYKEVTPIDPAVSGIYPVRLDTLSNLSDFNVLGALANKDVAKGSGATPTASTFGFTQNSNTAKLHREYVIDQNLYPNAYNPIYYENGKLRLTFDIQGFKPDITNFKTAGSGGTLDLIRLTADSGALPAWTTVLTTVGTRQTLSWTTGTSTTNAYLTYSDTVGNTYYNNGRITDVAPNDRAYIGRVYFEIVFPTTVTEGRYCLEINFGKNHESKDLIYRIYFVIAPRILNRGTVLNNYTLSIRSAAENNRTSQTISATRGYTYMGSGTTQLPVFSSNDFTGSFTYGVYFNFNYLNNNGSGDILYSQSKGITATSTSGFFNGTSLANSTAANFPNPYTPSAGYKSPSQTNTQGGVTVYTTSENAVVYKPHQIDVQTFTSGAIYQTAYSPMYPSQIYPRSVTGNRFPNYNNYGSWITNYDNWNYSGNGAAASTNPYTTLLHRVIIQFYVVSEYNIYRQDVLGIALTASDKTLYTITLTETAPNVPTIYDVYKTTAKNGTQQENTGYQYLPFSGVGRDGKDRGVQRAETVSFDFYYYNSGSFSNSSSTIYLYNRITTDASEFLTKFPSVAGSSGYPSAVRSALQFTVNFLPSTRAGDYYVMPYAKAETLTDSSVNYGLGYSLSFNGVNVGGANTVTYNWGWDRINFPAYHIEKVADKDSYASDIYFGLRPTSVNFIKEDFATQLAPGGQKTPLAAGKNPALRPPVGGAAPIEYVSSLYYEPAISSDPYNPNRFYHFYVTATYTYDDISFRNRVDFEIRSKRAVMYMIDPDTGQPVLVKWFEFEIDPETGEEYEDERGQWIYGNLPIIPEYTEVIFYIAAENEDFITYYHVKLGDGLENKELDITITVPDDFDGYVIVTLYTIFITPNKDTGELELRMTRFTTVIFSLDDAVASANFNGYITAVYKLANHISAYYIIDVRCVGGYDAHYSDNEYLFDHDGGASGILRPDDPNDDVQKTYGRRYLDMSDGYPQTFKLYIALTHLDYYAPPWGLEDWDW